MDGEQIPDEAVCELTEFVMPHTEAMAEHLSEFEIVTAIGFEYFRRRRCDIVVLKVGMGGEWDAINVIEDNEAAIREGLERVDWPGRFQLLAKDPLFIIDGSHNPQCLEALGNAVRTYQRAGDALRDRCRGRAHRRREGRPRGRGLRLRFAVHAGRGHRGSRAYG